MSFPRKRESIFVQAWMPAFAGMTIWDDFDSASARPSTSSGRAFRFLGLTGAMVPSPARCASDRFAISIFSRQCGRGL
ncbi:MAG TPA: hypothetical protein VIM38_14330, partial [Alphaproteobacteria bacterium]